MKTQLQPLALTLSLLMAAAGSAIAQDIPTAQQRSPATFDNYIAPLVVSSPPRRVASLAGLLGGRPSKANIKTGEGLKPTSRPS